MSGGKIRKRDGKSYRAERQVRKWNREEGEGKYQSEIIFTVEEGERAREKILQFEKDKAEELRNNKKLRYSIKHLKP